jgi:hypothetical protein
MKDANGGREYLVASTRGQRVGIEDDQAGDANKPKHWNQAASALFVAPLSANLALPLDRINVSFQGSQNGFDDLNVRKIGGGLEKRLANLWRRKRIAKKLTLVVGRKSNGKYQ